jgi:hypothetical protein
MNKKISCLVIFWFFLCFDSWSKPDVFFADSDNYDGAYLNHEIKDGKIKFLLTKPILSFKLPDDYFDLDKLKDYISTTYKFEDPAMKVDFEKMLGHSFESAHKAKEFLTELLSVLAGFKQEQQQLDKNQGGCASMPGNIPSNNYLFVFLILIYIFARFRKLIINY